MTAIPGHALLTDLYQLTMLDAYRRHHMRERAVFELFVRRLPETRGFLVMAGLTQALDYLEGLRFSAAEREWLAASGHFDRDFTDWLGQLRFEGDVWAMREGEVFFADEPVLRVEAPIAQAQLVETRLINILHFQTVIASKAARMTLAAGGRRVVDFGLRRAHGAEAGLWAARAACLAGFHGTATVEAGRRFGLPLAGTMAHSFVQAHASEREAFRRYAAARPGGLVLLIDTYDIDSAIDSVVEMAREGIAVDSVRLDSGDLAEGARRIRQRLDGAGQTQIGIIVSGSLDEFAIEELVVSGVPVDTFGVGTRLGAATDAPTLDMVYKLQSYAGKARRKTSSGKATWPGAKQVLRTHAPDGLIASDRIVRSHETGPGRPLLEQVMAGGRRLRAAPALADVQATAAEALATLPARCRRLRAPEPLQAEVSDALRALAAEVDAGRA